MASASGFDTRGCPKECDVPPLNLSGIFPCPLCGCWHLTVRRDQEVELHLGAGELAGYRVLALVTAASCDGCRVEVYRREDWGRGGVIERRALVPAEPPPPAHGRFYHLEVDD